MFKFDEGERVALKTDHPVLGLAAGATGTVWMRYDADPPAYDVTFATADGADFDAVMDENELRAESPAEMQGQAFALTQAIP